MKNKLIRVALLMSFLFFGIFMIRETGAQMEEPQAPMPTQSGNGSGGGFSESSMPCPSPPPEAPINFHYRITSADQTNTPDVFYLSNPVDSNGVTKWTKTFPPGSEITKAAIAEPLYPSKPYLSAKDNGPYVDYDLNVSFDCSSHEQTLTFSAYNPGSYLIEDFVNGAMEWHVIHVDAPSLQLESYQSDTENYSCRSEMHQYQEFDLPIKPALLFYGSSEDYNSKNGLAGVPDYQEWATVYGSENGIPVQEANGVNDFFSKIALWWANFRTPPTLDVAILEHGSGGVQGFGGLYGIGDGQISVCIGSSCSFSSQVQPIVSPAGNGSVPLAQYFDKNGNPNAPFWQASGNPPIHSLTAMGCCTGTLVATGYNNGPVLGRFTDMVGQAMKHTSVIAFFVYGPPYISRRKNGCLYRKTG